MQAPSLLARVPPWHLLLAALSVLLLLRLGGNLLPGLEGVGVNLSQTQTQTPLPEAPGAVPPLPVLKVAGVLVLQNAILLAALALLMRHHGLKLASLGLRPIPPPVVWREIGFGLLLVPILAILNLLWILLYFQFFETPVESSQRPILLAGPTTPLGNAAFFVAVTAFAPVTEELVFRGLLFTWLLARASPPVAVAVSAAVFAAVHMPPGIIPLMLCFGIAMAWRYLRTRSLWAPILAHCAFNGANLLLFYWARQIVAENEGILALIPLL